MNTNCFGEEIMSDFNAMQDSLVNCDQSKLMGLVNSALSAGTPASDILNQGLIAGMDIVGEKMESAGMEVHNLGVDIAPEDFVAQIKEKNAQIVCLSALLTTTMPMMKQTVDAIVEAGLRDQVKIMVGGAPVTKAFADEIGADGFAADAGSASKLAKSIAAYPLRKNRPCLK